MSFRTDAGSILATPIDRLFDRKNARSVRVFEYPSMGASDGFRIQSLWPRERRPACIGGESEKG